MIRELIRNGKVENSIYELQNLANKIQNQDLKKTIKRISDILCHNYNLNKWQFNQGFITIEDWNVFQAKAANTILDILEKVNNGKNSQIQKIDSPIDFSRITINSKICCWENRNINQSIENPIYNFHEQLIDEEIAHKIIDPVLDITLINISSEPVIINQIGFNPISARDDIKGIPISGRIGKTEEYILQVKDFILGKDELLQLEYPIYMESKAPFRFTLQLENYKKIALNKGNNTVIKLVISANKQRVESSLITMGMY